MSGAKIEFTYRDYKNLPESETERYELLEGEIVVLPSPTTYHQSISRNLGYVLVEFERKHDLGFIFNAPFDVVLSEENVVQPDILYFQGTLPDCEEEGEYPRST